MPKVFQVLTGASSSYWPRMSCGRAWQGKRRKIKGTRHAAGKGTSLLMGPANFITIVFPFQPKMCMLDNEKIRRKHAEK
jgi:hypothetical protein